MEYGVNQHLSLLFSESHILRGHKSYIIGIIIIKKREIISGEHLGDLRIWSIDSCVCIKHIPRVDYNLAQMKQHEGGDVITSYINQVRVWGATNNWGNPLKQINVCTGWAIEFLSGGLLLRGGSEGELEFIDYGETGCQLPPIQQLHSDFLLGIQRLAYNILLTASMDRYLKVIDPSSRKCYLKFKTGGKWMTVLAYIY